MKSLLILLLNNKVTLFVQVLLHHFPGLSCRGPKTPAARPGLCAQAKPPNTDVYRLTIVSSKVLQDRTTSNKAPIMLRLPGGQQISSIFHSIISGVRMTG